jgi:hypothetical protein
MCAGLVGSGLLRVIDDQHIDCAARRLQPEPAVWLSCGGNEIAAW